MARKSGISATNLVLMGGLAALILDRNLRDRLVGGTRSAYDQGRELLEDELVPALNVAAHQAGRSARHLAREGQHALADWQENDAPELLSRAQSWLGHASDVAARFAQDIQDEWQSRAADAEDAYDDFRKDARRTAARLARQGEDGWNELQKGARRAAKQGSEQLDDLQGSFLGFLGRTGDELEDRRRLMERDLSRARHDIERELHRGRKNWDAAKLERAVTQKLAPLQKEATREFARFEKDVLKQKRIAQRQSDAAGSVSGGMVAACALITGGAVLARSPRARAAVLDGVGQISPDARHHLERVGRSFRDSLGEIWVEGPEDKKTSDVKASAAGDASRDSGNPRPAGA